MTCERIARLLNDVGVAISKRQAVRLMTAKLDVFAAEEAAVFEAGLTASPYITVDDTGARHAGKSAYTTRVRVGPVHGVSPGGAEVATCVPAPSPGRRGGL
jgi:hypothetical protein